MEKLQGKQEVNYPFLKILHYHAFCWQTWLHFNSLKWISMFAMFLVKHADWGEKPSCLSNAHAVLLLLLTITTNTTIITLWFDKTWRTMLPSVSSTCLHRRYPRGWRLFRAWAATARSGTLSPSAILCAFRHKRFCFFFFFFLDRVVIDGKQKIPPKLVEPMSPYGSEKVGVRQHHSADHRVHWTPVGALSDPGLWPGALEDGGIIDEILAVEEGAADQQDQQQQRDHPSEAEPRHCFVITGLGCSGALWQWWNVPWGIISPKPRLYGLQPVDAHDTMLVFR